MGACSSNDALHKGTQFPSNTNIIIPSSGSSPFPRKQRPPTPPPPPPPDFTLDALDVTELDQIVDDVDFQSILDQEINLKVARKDQKTLSSTVNSLSVEKSRADEEWDGKYFVHGTSSDIVAEVKNKVHSCVQVSASEDIDAYVDSLSTMAVTANGILDDRYKQISALEQTTIKKLMDTQQTLINLLVQSGSFKMKQSESYYQKLIEDFIAKLEIQMSKHLDVLKQQLENNKIIIFNATNQKIQYITNISRQVKTKMFNNIEQTLEIQRTKLLQQIEMTNKETKQNFGYEQLRSLDMKVYSTISLDNPGEGCDNINDKKKYIDDLKLARPNQPLKRTVYIGTGSTKL